MAAELFEVLIEVEDIDPGLRREISIAAATVDKAWREGFDVGFRCQLRLSAAVTQILNARLRPERPFRAGQRMGRAVTIARPLAVSVIGGSLELALADSLAAKLDGLGITVGSESEPRS